MKKTFPIFLTFFLIISLTFPVLAHAGKTDSNGGHTDSSTGDYHYHHGYPAHAHFDIDGDGDIDCPYDFVDLTDHSSGTGSSSYSDGYNDGSKDGYTDGYTDGYKKGKIDGKEDGYAAGLRDGRAESASEYKKKISQTKNNAVLTTLLVFGLIVFLIGYVFYRFFSNRLTTVTINSIKNEKALKAAHEAYLKRQRKDYSDKLKQIQASHSDEIRKLKSGYETEIRNLKTQLREEKRLAILAPIVSGEDETIKLPDNIRLKTSCVAVKGKVRKYYPFGDYTVFMGRYSKKYHCTHDCSKSVIPMHLFDLPEDAEPCWKCVQIDMSSQPLPEWYDQIRHKLDSES